MAQREEKENGKFKRYHTSTEKGFIDIKLNGIMAKIYFEPILAYYFTLTGLKGNILSRNEHIVAWQTMSPT